MVSVEAEIREFASSSGSAKIDVFAASCAERMAPLFTGPVSSDPARSRDVELVIDCLDLLWQSTPAISWSEMTEKIGSLPELVGEEEPPGLLAYSYDAAAALYYAVKYKETRDLVNVISCANHALNSSEYVSEELDDGVDRYEREVQNQKMDISYLSRSNLPSNDQVTQEMRRRAQEIGRIRLAELIAG